MKKCIIYNFLIIISENLVIILFLDHNKNNMMTITVY